MNHDEEDECRGSLNVAHYLHEGSIFQKVLTLLQNILIELIRYYINGIIQSEPCESEALLLQLCTQLLVCGTMLQSILHP